MVPVRTREQALTEGKLMARPGPVWDPGTAQSVPLPGEAPSALSLPRLPSLTGHRGRGGLAAPSVGQGATGITETSSSGGTGSPCSILIQAETRPLRHPGEVGSTRSVRSGRPDHRAPTHLGPRSSSWRPHPPHPAPCPPGQQRDKRGVLQVDTEARAGVNGGLPHPVVMYPPRPPPEGLLGTRPCFSVSGEVLWRGEWSGGGNASLPPRVGRGERGGPSELRLGRSWPGLGQRPGWGDARVRAQRREGKRRTDRHWKQNLSGRGTEEARTLGLIPGLREPVWGVTGLRHEAQRGAWG